MAQPEIASAVKDAVRAWGRAKDPEAGARALAEARRSLPAELMPQLVQELAEISAELLLSMLTRADGLDPGFEAVEVAGVPLHPKQAERLGAWLADQLRTARALGLELGSWQHLLESAMTRLGDEPAGPSSQALDPYAAKRLVGTVTAGFENRPGPGGSAKAGLRGLLSARRFKPGGKST